MLTRSILGVLLGGLFAAQANALELSPFKDRLFAYPEVLASRDDGAHLTIDYREMRDINGRDEVPEKRVKGSYVSLAVREEQRDLVLRTEAGDIAHFAVGTPQNAAAIVVYLHGQGGSRHQGVSDFTFGGNFNRIKNLMAENGGLYLSPDFPDFETEGGNEIRALIDHYREASPKAEVVVACGSMGGALCWRLASDRDAAERLDGLLLLGSMWSEGFVGSPAFAARVPVLFGHGSRDTVFPVEKQEAFFDRIRKAAPDYPARFIRFETGTHGTPIRMVDWRGALNWIFAQP